MHSQGREAVRFDCAIVHKVELLPNLKAAKALGLALPVSSFSRADELRSNKASIAAVHESVPGPWWTFAQMFWPLPASFLTGASAAAGIAAINSLGNLSGFAGPYAMGYLKDLTGNFTAGLLLLAGCALAGAIVVVMVRIDARREQLSEEIAMAH